MCPAFTFGAQSTTGNKINNTMSEHNMQTGLFDQKKSHFKNMFILLCGVVVLMFLFCRAGPI